MPFENFFCRFLRLNLFQFVKNGRADRADRHTDDDHRRLRKKTAFPDEIAHYAHENTYHERNDRYLEVGRDENERQSAEDRRNNVRRNRFQNGDDLVLKKNERDKPNHDDDRRDDTADGNGNGRDDLLLFASFFHARDVLRVQGARKFQVAHVPRDERHVLSARSEKGSVTDRFHKPYRKVAEQEGYALSERLPVGRDFCGQAVRNGYHNARAEGDPSEDHAPTVHAVVV